MSQADPKALIARLDMLYRASLETNVGHRTFVEQLVPAWPALRALALEAVRLREALTAFKKDHDGIADTMYEPIAGPAEGRPPDGWKCGCDLCKAAEAALTPASSPNPAAGDTP